MADKALRRQLPEPPDYLRAATKDWYRKVVGEFDLEDHHLRLLDLAARMWDRAEECRAVLAKEGLTFVDRWDCPRPRPEIAAERNAVITFCRVMRELALDVEAPESRPPHLPGNNRR